MKYIDIDEVVYQVGPNKIKASEMFTITSDDLLEGNAYKVGKYVLPYRGMRPFSKKLKVGIWKINDDKFKYVMPFTDKQKEKYSKRHIYENSIDNILSLIENQSIRDSDDLLILMSDCDDVFKPTIRDSDNFLQILVKEMIIHKNISLDAYKPRFINPGDMNNHKKGLLHHGKMSVEKAIKWAGVMDFDIHVELRDKQGTSNQSNIVASFDTEHGLYLWETDDTGEKTKGYMLDFNNPVELNTGVDLEEVE